MEPLILIYLGERDHGHLYAAIDSLESNGGTPIAEIKPLPEKSRFQWFTKNMGKCLIGGIYAFESDGNSISYKKTMVPIGFWKNVEDKAKWRLEYNTFRLSKAQLKENTEANMALLLEPIRSMYRKATRDQQTLILAEIIRIVTR